MKFLSFFQNKSGETCKIFEMAGLYALKHSGKTWRKEEVIAVEVIAVDIIFNIKVFIYIYIPICCHGARPLEVNFFINKTSCLHMKCSCPFFF